MRTRRDEHRVDQPGAVQVVAGEAHQLLLVPVDGELVGRVAQELDVGVGVAVTASLKRALKKRRISYRELGKRLRLSESGVKKR